MKTILLKNDNAVANVLRSRLGLDDDTEVFSGWDVSQIPAVDGVREVCGFNPPRSIPDDSMVHLTEFGVTNGLTKEEMATMTDDEIRTHKSERWRKINDPNISEPAAEDLVNQYTSGYTIISDALAAKTMAKFAMAFSKFQPTLSKNLADSDDPEALVQQIKEGYSDLLDIVLKSVPQPNL